MNRRRCHCWPAILLALMCGCCVTPMPRVDLSAPGWKMREGQAVWHGGRTGPEIAGELQVATNNDGRVWLQFMKPPLPLVVAQMSRERWQFEVVAQNRRYCGPGKPPGRIAWLQLARAASGGELGSGWVWTPKPDGAWRLDNVATGEWIEGYLSP